ncbi:hypothetical protein L249_5439 [Ophiocordyceps polyrhachis-furcata BCC 54312]|uniref:Importin N-terminal domain-containing protein n=1 Tax=Ophiocordyceps polyrhachis-furcata BCC 54312 TaxID=1330021 RepID=A0A367L986_9HYPO|nr:hypothetical protein L249_5439 [Ophiocordyceps polyrhachis-furcata BCC 54312]
MEDPRLHLSLDQVEHLILSLYQPNPPQIIADAQASLSRFQCSPRAWAMIQDLLERPDENVKFFGALTLIIKLNKESATLSNDDATELLIRLIGWYIRSLMQADSLLVLKKLSSAIATYFIQFHYLWPCYLRHLVICLASSRSLSTKATLDTGDTTAALNSLCAKRLQAVIWVLTSVMEDVSRIDLTAGNKSVPLCLYNAVMRNVPDAMALMTRCLSSGRSASNIFIDSIKCIQSWVSFTQKTSPALTHDTLFLRPLVGAVVLSLPDRDMFEASAELLVDILCNCPSLLTDEQYDSLAKVLGASWAQDRYHRLLKGDFEFESLQFGQLLLAFGEARTEALMQSNDSSCSQLLSALCDLLNADGYPVAEDKIFVSAVEFWSTYTEEMADVVHFGPNVSSNSWVPNAAVYVSQAVSNAWRKILYPPLDVFQQWDSTDRVGFNDARKDVLDLLQSAYTVLGSGLVANFKDLILSTLQSSSWLPLEAAAFCLGGLADCGKGDGRFDEALTSVFSSPLFSTILSMNQDIDLRTRQTCFYLIEQYSEYFERHITLLGPTLRLLFAALSEQSTAASASRSILLLCSSCRHHLYPLIDEFLHEYSTRIMETRLDCVSNEKVLGAIASIAQAIPDPDRRHGVCTRILEFVQNDVTVAQEIGEASDPGPLHHCQSVRCSRIIADEHPATHTGLRALKCLVSVGKGYQSPSDTTVDVDHGCNQQDESSGALTGVHDKILRIVVQLQHTFPKSSEVTELICSVFRCGFSEVDPGPFAFRPSMVAQFLMSNSGEPRSKGLFVSSACSLVSSVRCNGSSDRTAIFSSLLLWVVGLLRQLPDPDCDPELTQNGIEFASRILARAPLVVLGLQPKEAAEFFLMFTINTLDGREPLPKGAAADFWTAFVSLKNDDHDVEPAMRRAMQTLGPHLAQSLARNFGGHALRSELDKLSEPLKKLVVRHPMAKEWLQSGLDHCSFPSNQITAEQKDIFIKKIISLRGSRATNQIIREFWLTSRGSNFAYAS